MLALRHSETLVFLLNIWLVLELAQKLELEKKKKYQTDTHESTAQRHWERIYPDIAARLESLKVNLTAAEDLSKHKERKTITWKVTGRI